MARLPWLNVGRVEKRRTENVPQRRVSLRGGSFAGKRLRFLGTRAADTSVPLSPEKGVEAEGRLLAGDRFVTAINPALGRVW